MYRPISWLAHSAPQGAESRCRSGGRRARFQDASGHGFATSFCSLTARSFAQAKPVGYALINVELKVGCQHDSNSCPLDEHHG